MRPRAERGATLVEVVLTAALAVVVATTALGTLDATTRAARRHDDAVTARQRVRQALDEVAATFRSASEVVPDGDAPRHVLTVVVQRSSGAAKVLIEARPRDGQVRRIGDRGERLLLDGLAETKVATFRYHDGAGRELDPAGSAGEVARCAASVTVTFAVAGSSGNVLSAQRTVALRNRPGGAPC